MKVLNKSRLGQRVLMACVVACGLRCSPSLQADDNRSPESVESPAAVVTFRDEPAAHALFDRMNEAIKNAQSLSYTCQYQRTIAGKITQCRYEVWLKKPNFFRMQTVSAAGEPVGIMIGDGSTLWVYWPNGRPRWQYVTDSDEDEKTRQTSYMTKPAPQSKHSIWHEAIFLGGGMTFPILEPSVFHGYVDPMQEKHLDGVRSLGTETVGTEECHLVEVSLVGGQRCSKLWLSTQDFLPRKLAEIVHVKEPVATEEIWSRVIVNGEIDESMFAWKPPSNWTRWNRPDAEENLLQPGEMAPDFELTSLDGGKIKLSEYRGRSVWLCFWRVGCPPCREELPVLQEISQKYHDKGLVILGVNVSDQKPIVVDLLREKGVTFPNILDTSEAAQNVEMRDYHYGGWPTNYLINGDGIVVEGWVGNRGWNQEMKSALFALLKAGGQLGDDELPE